MIVLVLIMNKKNLRIFSLWCLILGIVIFIVSYIMFHFLTDNGFTMEFNEEPGKPFITNMVADLGVLFVFSSIISFMASCIFFKKDK